MSNIAAGTSQSGKQLFTIRPIITPGGGEWPRSKSEVAYRSSGLPLHSKRVPRLDWEKADVLVREHASQFAELWFSLTGPFRNPSWLKRVSDEAPTATRSDGHLDLEDLEQLVAENLLVEVTPGEARRFSQSFTVAELSKRRRRWIVWPKWLNDVTPKPELPDNLFPSVGGEHPQQGPSQSCGVLRFCGFLPPVRDR